MFCFENVWWQPQTRMKPQKFVHSTYLNSPRCSSIEVLYCVSMELWFCQFFSLICHISCRGRWRLCMTFQYNSLCRTPIGQQSIGKIDIWYHSSDSATLIYSIFTPENQILILRKKKWRTSSLFYRFWRQWAALMPKSYKSALRSESKIVKSKHKKVTWFTFIIRWVSLRGHEF